MQQELEKLRDQLASIQAKIEQLELSLRTEKRAEKTALQDLLAYLVTQGLGDEWLQIHGEHNKWNTE